MAHFALSTVIAIAVVLPAMSAQSSGHKFLPGESYPSLRPSPCLSFPANPSGDMAVVSSFVPEPTYVDVSIEQLKEIVPLLSQLRPEGIDSVGGNTTLLANTTEYILSKTGVAITDLFHKSPNLLADENVVLTDVNLRLGFKYKSTSDYVYRILHNRNPSGGDTLAEFRTYTNDNPLDDSPSNPNRLINIGYATIWQVFLPSNLQDSHFRYLGEQLVGKRKTYALAFAQNPEGTGLRPTINYSVGQCTTPLQGIVWIDQSTFQILRIQSGLLHSLPDIQVSQLRTVLTYESVKIRGLDLSLWLPETAETTYHATYREVKETHSYSNYRLFKATMKVLPGLR